MTAGTDCLAQSDSSVSHTSTITQIPLFKQVSLPYSFDHGVPRDILQRQPLLLAPSSLLLCLLVQFAYLRHRRGVVALIIKHRFEVAVVFLRRGCNIQKST